MDKQKAAQILDEAQRSLDILEFQAKRERKKHNRRKQRRYEKDLNTLWFLFQVEKEENNV
jgi:hypothetical protein